MSEAAFTVKMTRVPLVTQYVDEEREMRLTFSVLSMRTVCRHRQQSSHQSRRAGTDVSLFLIQRGW